MTHLEGLTSAVSLYPLWPAKSSNSTSSRQCSSCDNVGFFVTHWRAVCPSGLILGPKSINSKKLLKKHYKKECSCEPSTGEVESTEGAPGQPGLTWREKAWSVFLSHKRFIMVIFIAIRVPATNPLPTITFLQQNLTQYPKGENCCYMQQTQKPALKGNKIWMWGCAHTYRCAYFCVHVENIKCLVLSHSALFPLDSDTHWTGLAVSRPQPSSCL